MNGLEPDGEIIQRADHTATHCQGIQNSRIDASLFDDSRRNGSIVLFPDLDCNKTREKHSREYEESDDACTFPCISGTTPLKSDIEAYNAWEEEGRANGVELLDPITECLAVVGWAWDMKDECRDGNDNGANGKIDVETPSPGDLVRKDTPE